MNQYMRYLKNRKGQGTTEYIVILALIIGLLVAFFPKIQEKISAKADQIGTMIETGKAK